MKRISTPGSKNIERHKKHSQLNWMKQKSTNSSIKNWKKKRREKSIEPKAKQKLTHSKSR